MWLRKFQPTPTHPVNSEQILNTSTPTERLDQQVVIKMRFCVLVRTVRVHLSDDDWAVCIFFYRLSQPTPATPTIPGYAHGHCHAFSSSSHRNSNKFPLHRPHRPHPLFHSIESADTSISLFQTSRGHCSHTCVCSNNRNHGRSRCSRPSSYETPNQPTHI